MFTILPCKDGKRLSYYPEGTTLLIYSENSQESGHIAYIPNKSAVEIISMELGVSDPESREAFLVADALIRSVGSIALNASVITLCTKLQGFDKIFSELGFFSHGDYLTLYLNKLFSGVCKGCSGSCH